MRAPQGSTVFILSDLRNTLAAALTLLETTEVGAEYRRGFVAAIAFFATALGVPWHEIERQR